MHIEIYRNLEHAYAIVHTHSPAATAVSIAGEEIPPITPEMISEIGDRIPLAEYACPGTRKLGKMVLEALREANTALTRNHGAVAVGPGLRTALKRAILVEELAKLFTLARMIGRVGVIASDEAAKFKRVAERWKKINRLEIISEWIEELRILGAED